MLNFVSVAFLLAGKTQGRSVGLGKIEVSEKNVSLSGTASGKIEAVLQKTCQNRSCALEMEPSANPRNNGKLFHRQKLKKVEVGAQRR